MTMNPFSYPPESLFHPGVAGQPRAVPVDLGVGHIFTMMENELLRLSAVHEDDNEIVHWVQYHLPASGQMVHRSAHVHLKKACLPLQGETAAIG